MGAVFAEDVRPSEEMKLRMLNGSHSMLAYAGFLAGHRHVNDVMRDHALAQLVRRYLTAAARTLPPAPGVDLPAYADALVARFETPHLAHHTYQIGMDGTRNLPQRIVAPAIAARLQSLDAYALATAAWMRYVTGRTEAGAPYALRAPREDALPAAAQGAKSATALAQALIGLPGLFPAPLREDALWTRAVTDRPKILLERGMAAAIAREAVGLDDA
ncbi:MAG: hypothetical protein ACP5EN_03670 [Rhodovulum sp.]